jgi:hypothetical protein
MEIPNNLIIICKKEHSTWCLHLLTYHYQGKRWFPICSGSLVVWSMRAIVSSVEWHVLKAGRLLWIRLSIGVKMDKKDLNGELERKEGSDLQTGTATLPFLSPWITIQWSVSSPKPTF